MKIQIDVKSAIAGLCAGVILMFTLGAASDGPAKPVGKYQVSTGAGFAFITDTSTGKTWFANVSAQNKVNIDYGFFDAKDGR